MNPISDLVTSAMSSIKEMIDVNTIVGEPVETTDGTLIIPISRVSCGFGAGGAEFGNKPKTTEADSSGFGGGTGAGVSIAPVGFLVVTGGHVQLLPVSTKSPDKLADYIPVAIDKVTEYIKKKKDSKAL